MNPNKTKDFDLRQAHSVVYQRSQVDKNCEHTCRGNEMQDLAAPAADLESPGPRSECRRHVAASVSAEPERDEN